jgi:hypothetical protein
MAWWHREYAKEQSAEDRENYACEEEGARAARRGLWMDAKPVPFGSAGVSHAYGHCLSFASQESRAAQTARVLTRGLLVG